MRNLAFIAIAIIVAFHGQSLGKNVGSILNVNYCQAAHAYDSIINDLGQIISSDKLNRNTAAAYIEARDTLITSDNIYNCALGLAITQAIYVMLYAELNKAANANIPIEKLLGPSLCQKAELGASTVLKHIDSAGWSGKEELVSYMEYVKVKGNRNSAWVAYAKQFSLSFKEIGGLNYLLFKEEKILNANVYCLDNIVKHPSVGALVQRVAFVADLGFYLKGLYDCMRLQKEGYDSSRLYDCLQDRLKTHPYNWMYIGSDTPEGYQYAHTYAIILAKNEIINWKCSAVICK